MEDFGSSSLQIGWVGLLLGGSGVLSLVASDHPKSFEMVAFSSSTKRYLRYP